MGSIRGRREGIVSTHAISTGSTASLHLCVTCSRVCMFLSASVCSHSLFSPITTYQPTYYIAKSFADAKQTMQQFSSSFARNYNVRYNPLTQTLEVDGNVDLVQIALEADKPAN